MIEIKQDCYKGTRIILNSSKRVTINCIVTRLRYEHDFKEIEIPIIQYQELFKGKVGEENNNLMFNFKDRGDRDLCLAPEYTAIIQNLANTYFKTSKDVKLFYVQECFRGEKPQLGRYRQFTQLGVEIINPSKDYLEYLSKLALELTTGWGYPVELNLNVTRGLDYYKEGKGFEIRNNKGLQLCGGGEYKEGIGFAIGIDRLIL